MKKPSENITEISAEQMNTLIHDFLANNKTFKDVRGITDKEMESIYAIAYNFYNHGKFDRANDLFTALCQMDTYQSKYWIGLGAARQMQKKYEKAIDAYGMATLFDTKNPFPAFYAAHCCMKLKDHDRAIQALEAVIQIAKDKKEYKDLYPQAEQLLEGLHKKTPQQKTK